MKKNTVTISRKVFREIIIQEYFEDLNGDVCRFWRIVGEKDWRVDSTPYKEIPFVYLKNTED